MHRAPLLAALLAAAALAAPPPWQQRVLPNGLTVLVAEDHAQPLVTVELAAHNGSMTEPPEYNGLSHLYEHMFFKGNQVLPDQEAWLNRARSLGMAWNGTTNTERVNYFFTTTRSFSSSCGSKRGGTMASRMNSSASARWSGVVGKK